MLCGKPGEPPGERPLAAVGVAAPEAGPPKVAGGIGWCGWSVVCSGLRPNSGK